MKYLQYILSLCLTGSLWACSEKDLTPIGSINNFLPDPEATDEESVLRRDFFEENGFYILFNDTLNHELLGKDSEGDPYYATETIDPCWNLTGYDEYTDYSFVYCNSIEEKRLRAEFVSGLAKTMVEFNLTRPYSILVVDTITTTTEDYYGNIITNHPGFISTLRCFIVALPEIKGTEEEKYLLIANMAGSGIASKYEGNLQPFYDLAKNEWGASMYDSYNNFESTIEEYYALGFLNMSPDEYYCTREEDVASYIHLLMTMTEEEVYKKFVRYDIILQKYEIIKEVALQAGMKFN